MSDINYLSGLGNELSSEAREGALPKRGNTPQRVAFDLVAEQINGTAFTAKPETNKRSWQYRLRPSVGHQEYTLDGLPKFWQTADHCETIDTPEQLRWNARICKESLNLWESMWTLCVCGSMNGQTGGAIHLYEAVQSETNSVYVNADAEMMFLPFEGTLKFFTEFGRIEAAPGEIIVIPRGVRFSVEPGTQKLRGYMCENYGMPFQIPYRGPIGANGMATPRHFQIPTAKFENNSKRTLLRQKYLGKFWQARYEHSPLNVVAWHGNLYPYKYSLENYNTMGSISFDHPDPSIFTVMTSPSHTEGVANIDFVIFPWRWLVMEDSFRPPYYHRNYMSEYMGLISGQYDAKPEGFQVGGSSLHNMMTAHGPDFDTYLKASAKDLSPEKLDSTMAFMMETHLPWKPTKQSINAVFRDRHYLECWTGHQKQTNDHFKET